MYAPPIEAPTRTYGGMIFAVWSTSRRSPLISSTMSVMGPGSLHAYPARSYVQIRVNLDTPGCTNAQSIEKASSPFSTTTVGEPFPVQWRCIRRPPISMRLPKGRGFGGICAIKEIVESTAAERLTYFISALTYLWPKG